MKLAYYIKDSKLELDPRVLGLLADLGSAGFDVTPVSTGSDVPGDVRMLLSFGGDGTFLSAAALAKALDLPVLGVNFGRLGFLSENKPEDVAAALAAGDYSIQKRGMLKAEGWCLADGPQLALNEVCVLRKGTAMLGIDVQIDSRPLPTYWADGLLVATSSGSTAYSLSAGGPICLPDARVLIVAPVAPHNLNVRPLVVPDTSDVRISFRSRDEKLMLTVDNRGFSIPSSSVVNVVAVPEALKRVVLGGSNFIEALRARLLWGGDVRNLPQL
ncbi:MAG: NAD(+)/NADH kinase [Bacteroidales bacterium]|nr:NAD(+)/NADH kinase [Bacteroidales bacterium]